MLDIIKYNPLAERVLEFELAEWDNPFITPSDYP
jgi:hypothetical protein